MSKLKMAPQMAKAAPAKTKRGRAKAARGKVPRRPLRHRLAAHRRALWRGGLAFAVFAGVTGSGIWALQVNLPGRALEAAEALLFDGMRHAGLTVNEVIVVGRRETKRTDIARKLGVRRGDPILALDLDDAKERLETLGWVRSATITRRLPGDLHVHLAERRPFALWQKNRRLALIDREGAEITTEDLGRFRQLPVVVGRDAPQHVGTLFDALASQPQLFQRVSAAVRIAARRWDVRLDNGIVIRLPEENVGGGWSRLAALEKVHGILNRDLSAIDLRLDDRLIVRLGAEAAKKSRQKGQKGKST